MEGISIRGLELLRVIRESYSSKDIVLVRTPMMIINLWIQKVSGRIVMLAGPTEEQQSRPGSFP
jgi:hypothetical protein